MAKKHRSYEPSRSRTAAELRLVKVVFEQDPNAHVGRLNELNEYKRDSLDEFMHVRAVAEVRIAGIDQVLTSAGTYGVESDSETEYLEAIATEEWKALRGVLKAVGVPTSELPLEVDRTWVEWRM